MNRPVLRIRCNDRKRKILSRLAAFTFPLWGPGAWFALLTCLSSWQYSAWEFWAIFLGSAIVASAGIAETWDLLRSQLVGDGKILNFPGIFGQQIELCRLKKISTSHDSLRFHYNDIYDKPGHRRVEQLSLSRLNLADRQLLLKYLEKYAPSCVVDEDCRRVISGDESAVILDKNETVRLPYDSHSRLKAFYDVCLQYEKFFWSVWAACCAPFTIMLIPPALMIPVFFYRRFFSGERFSYFPMPQFISDWMRCWKPMLSTIGSELSTLGSFYDWLGTHPEASIVIMLAAGIVFFQCLRLLARPTGIVLSSRGFFREYGNLGLFFKVREFAWDHCKKVVCDSSENGKVAEQSLRFEGSYGVLTILGLSGLPKVSSRLFLKKAIELWAPDAELDASFVETAAAPQRVGYTELWLRSLNSPPKRDRLTPLVKGDKLKGGSITILETIGAGGQGVAYLAESRDINGSVECVVVKEFILPVYVDRRARLQALERFEHEAQLLRSLNHNQIVALKDHFIEDHRAYLVLEHINGKSLRKMCSREGLKDQELLRHLACQMCEILLHLHAQAPPMVHRDFTPDNLILDKNGVLKLIDFNVAHQVVNDKKATVVGKHAYMPPEQFAGRPRPQSDIYALGATLFYLLAGEDPEPFSQSGLPKDRLDVNPVWGEIIMKCTALKIDERYKSTTEIMKMLSCLDNEQDKQSNKNREVGDEAERIEILHPEVKI